MKKDVIYKILDMIKTLEDQRKIISILDSEKKDLEKILIESFPELSKKDVVFVLENLSGIRSLILQKKEVVIYAPIRLSKEILDLIYLSLANPKSSLVLNSQVDADITAGIKIVSGGKIYDYTFDGFVREILNS